MAPPLVLLHGYMATLTMWSPNIAAFSKDYRVYAIDVMGQPSKSRPEEPIGNAADFASWLTATLDALHLDRVFLVGMSFGGWLALIPEFEGELVPACRHEMCASQHRVVDGRILEFLETTRTDDRAETANRSVAVLV